MDNQKPAGRKKMQISWSSLRDLRDQPVPVGVFYLCIITFAEAITTMADAYFGMFFHSVVLVILLIHGSLVRRGTLRRFLLLLTLAPLIRMLSLSLPLAKLGLPVIYWYMVIGALLFIAAFVAGRVTDLAGQRIGWSWRNWPAQLVMGLSGFGLGYFEFKILNPGPLANYITWMDILVASLILLIFTGVLEEYIFRGLMQSATMQLMGKPGLVYVAVLFAILHLGYHSLADLIFVLLVGLYFGWWAWKTHSLLGASLAHGIANISLYVMFPLLLNSNSLPVSSSVALDLSPTPMTAMESDATSAANANLSPVDVLVDNEDPGFVYTGKPLWLDSTDGFHNSFHWYYASQSVPEVVASWVPNLRGCGRYRVEVFIPPGDGLTESARYIIHHRLGSAEVGLDQAAHRGTWTTLGIFEFESTIPVSLQLSNWTGEDQKLFRWIGFDAVRWVFMTRC
jgi:uncharacterized protein